MKFQVHNIIIIVLIILLILVGWYTYNLRIVFDYAGQIQAKEYEIDSQLILEYEKLKTEIDGFYIEPATVVAQNSVGFIQISLKNKLSEGAVFNIKIEGDTSFEPAISYDEFKLDFEQAVVLEANETWSSSIEISSLGQYTLQGHEMPKYIVTITTEDQKYGSGEFSIQYLPD